MCIHTYILTRMYKICKYNFYFFFTGVSVVI